MSKEKNEKHEHSWVDVTRIDETSQNQRTFLCADCEAIKREHIQMGRNPRVSLDQVYSAIYKMDESHKVELESDTVMIIRPNGEKILLETLIKQMERE
jgi:hypothetical protein